MGDRSVRETSVRRVRAFNSATASQNKIHDDAVARQFGFAGGLVPGVDVYAYLTHLPAARWGRAWLEQGTMSARFHRPVYDGDEVEIAAENVGSDEGGPHGEMALTLRDSAGEVCATATVGLPARPATAPDPSRWPEAPLPTDPPPATPETLTAGATLGSLAFGFHADAARDYLDEVGEDLALYRDDGIAHPGWALRSANRLLAANVRLGPWIHVSSRSTHHGVVVDGDQLSTRGRVSAVFERKGHRFVTLDVLVVAGGTRPVLAVEHTAIYQPRRIT